MRMRRGFPYRERQPARHGRPRKEDVRPIGVLRAHDVDARPVDERIAPAGHQREVLVVVCVVDRVNLLREQDAEGLQDLHDRRQL